MLHSIPDVRPCFPNSGKGQALGGHKRGDDVVPTQERVTGNGRAAPLDFRTHGVFNRHTSVARFRTILEGHRIMVAFIISLNHRIAIGLNGLLLNSLGRKTCITLCLGVSSLVGNTV
ncbi:hypothetical protein D3C75_1113460 [compost metagenome]